ncbi:MAG: NAD-binding protein [Caulobacteraceae bacterium]
MRRVAPSTSSSRDLGIVQDMARAERFPVPLAAAALQMYLAASGAGMGQDDDASLARLYAQLSGAKLPEKAF